MNNRHKIAMLACYALVFGALSLMAAACFAPDFLIEAIAAQGGE